MGWMLKERATRRPTFCWEKGLFRGLREWRGDEPVGFGCDEFGDCVREGGVGADMKDGVGVFAVVHAAGGECDGDEVDAGVFEEGGRGGCGEELVELVGYLAHWRREGLL